MKATVILFIASVVAHAVNLVESGYLVTCPRLFRAGSTQELSVSLIDVNETWSINAAVTYRHGRGDIIASGGAQFTDDSDGTLKLEIPRDLNTDGKKSINAKLSVSGGPVGGKLVFQSSRKITIEIPKNSVFIQTDKPIYKPGQTVNMRIVGVDDNLKPLTGQVTRVTITSPGGVRTMQWDNLDFVVGIVSLKFPLSSQPVLGDWKIDATVQGEKKTLVFTVDKYVLPKFEVTIEPPSFVSMKSKELKATVCAHYTYGQPVKGTVSVLFQLEVRRYFWQSSSHKEKMTKEKEINGCTDVTFSRYALRQQYNSRSVGYGKVTINATVKEAATGVSQNATGAEIELVRATAKLQFLPSTPKEFKAGMVYTGQVKATQPDGSPMKGESIKIIVKSARGPGSRYYGYYGYDKLFEEHFTVPENGLVDFAVNGSKIPQTAKSLNLEAQYKGQTLAYFSAKRWYSPSNSYVSMERIASPLKVGSTAKVMFDFTTRTDTKNINFYYQVFSRGILVAQGRKLHAVDYQPSMKTVKNSKDEEMFTSRGFIQFAVTQKMVPSSRLLLFYVRDDQETVADNMLIDVEDTLENEVNVRFADSIRKPGESTRLIITAAPGSQVAVTAVDKSVHLLKGGNELTQDDAIEVLSSQDVGPSGGYSHSSCYSPPWWSWGPWQRRKRSMLSYYGSTKDLDASRAFENSGVIYFSDLKIETAKCERPRFRPYHRGPEAMVSELGGRGGADGAPVLEDVDDNDGGRVTSKKKQGSKRKPVRVRKEFPETWLWTEEVIK